MLDSFKSWEDSISNPKKHFDFSRFLAEKTGKKPSGIIKDLQDKNGGMNVTEMCEFHLASGACSDEYITFLVNNNVISSEQTSIRSTWLQNVKAKVEGQLREYEQNHKQFCDKTVEPAREIYAAYQRELRILHSRCETLRNIIRPKDRELKGQESNLAKQLGSRSLTPNFMHICTKTDLEELRTKFKESNLAKQLGSRSLTPDFMRICIKTNLEELRTRFNEVSSSRAKVTQSILNWKNNIDQLGRLQRAEHKLNMCLSGCGHSLDDTGVLPGSKLYKDISNYCNQTKEFIRILYKISEEYNNYKSYIDSKKVELTKFVDILKEKKEQEERILTYKLEKEILDKDINDIGVNYQNVQRIERIGEENRLQVNIGSDIPANVTINDMQSAWEDIDNVTNQKEFVDLLEFITNRIHKKCSDVLKEIQKKTQGKEPKDICKMHLANSVHSNDHLAFLTKENNTLVNAAKMFELYNDLIKQKEEMNQHLSKYEQDYLQFHESVFDPAVAAYVAYQRNIRRLFSGYETFGGVAKQRDGELEGQESEIKEYISQFGQENRAATEGMWRLLIDPKKEELKTKFNKVSSQRVKATKQILGWNSPSKWQREKNSSLNQLRIVRDKLELYLHRDEEGSSGNTGPELEPLLRNKISDYCNKVSIMVNLLEITHKMQETTKSYIDLEKIGLTLFTNVLKKEKEWKESAWEYRLEGQILAHNITNTWSNYLKMVNLESSSRRRGMRQIE
jgi:hypothetical protein